MTSKRPPPPRVPSESLLFFQSPQRKSKRNQAKQKETHLTLILSFFGGGEESRLNLRHRVNLCISPRVTFVPVFNPALSLSPSLPLLFHCPTLFHLSPDVCSPAVLRWPSKADCPPRPSKYRARAQTPRQPCTQTNTTSCVSRRDTDAAGDPGLLSQSLQI